MLSTRLKNAIAAYIDSNFKEISEDAAFSRVAPEHAAFSGKAPEDFVLECECAKSAVWDETVLKDAGDFQGTPKSQTLEELVEEVGESFHEMLFLRIDMSGMTDVEVYKRANMDRKLFSKIRSNPAYHPQKQTVIALAIALRLNLADTEDLLARAEYALSPGNKRDLIISFFIERGIYDLAQINDALYEFGQEPLNQGEGAEQK